MTGRKLPQPDAHLPTIHDSRALMLEDLVRLVEAAPVPPLTPDIARQATVVGNVLAKRTQRTRQVSFQYLHRLYGLDERTDAGQVFFRLLRNQPAARGQLAAVLGLQRDRLLRSSLPFILSFREGQMVEAAALGTLLRESGETFNDRTLGSVVQKLLLSWSQAGWVSSSLKKHRLAVEPLPESVAFALFLGHQDGRRGLALLDSLYMQAFASSPDTLDELAYQASKLGYLSYRRIDDVLEIQFPQLQASAGQRV